MYTEVIPQTNIRESIGTAASQAVFDVEKINIYEGQGLDPITVIHFYWLSPYTAKKLWGLFQGIKIEDEDMKIAKQSLFPNRF